MPSPFMKQEIEYDENNEPIYTNQPYGDREPRFNETQREWFWKNQQLHYENSVDQSDRMIWELYLLTQKLDCPPPGEYESLHEYLARPDIQSILMKGENDEQN